MREDLRHFIDTSMGKQEKYELLGNGVESLTEEMNPEEETKHYIHQASSSNKIKSYQRTFDVDKEDCEEDAVQTWIDGLVDTLPVGASAKTSFVRMRLKDEVNETPGTYKAIKVPCTGSGTSSGGDGGDYVNNAISVKQCGDDIPGTFDLSTKTFTATK